MSPGVVSFDISTVAGPLRADGHQARGRARRGGEPFGQLLLGPAQAELGVQQLLHHRRPDRAHRGRPLDGPRVGEVDREPQSSEWAGVVQRGSAEQGQLAVAQLEGDLGECAEVVLQRGQRVPEEVGAPGHGRQRFTDAGGNLAAHPAMEGAVRLQRAGVGVAADRRAVPRPLPGADVQGLHVQGQAEVVGQVLRPAGPPAAGGVPAPQQGLRGQSQLLGGVVGERLAALLLDQIEERGHPGVAVDAGHGVVEVVRVDVEGVHGDQREHRRPDVVQPLLAADEVGDRVGVAPVDAQRGQVRW
jgi:hypothetical protein